MSYLAHISKDHLREQTILEHSQNVASLAAEFAKSFNAESWGYCCGLLHDIGKYTSEFQERLKGGPSVDHATAAAKELADKKGYHTLAAYCVAGHHAGLPDGGTTADDRNSASLKGRLKKRVPDYQEYKKEIKIPDLKAPAVRPLGNGGFMVSFFLRMIYSCLVDADFLDTEDFMNVGKALRNPERISQKHLDRLLAYVAPWMSNTDLQTVNGRRTEILKHCLEMGKEKPGLFSLTVPTGGGKTISSLSFALQQACTYGKERIIYVIPYKSII